MKKNVLWVTIAAAALIAANLACTLPGGSPTPVPGPTKAPATVPPTVPPTEPPTVPPTLPPTEPPMDTAATATPEPQTEAGAASLEIVNQSGIELWFAYISPSQSDEWGEDWLGDAIILDGESFVVQGIPEGVYDIRLEDESGQAVELAWEVTLEGESSWTVTGQASLEVVNNSSEIITFLYISPVESDTWGEDWLGDAVIDVGESLTVDAIPPGVYDIQAADGEDESIEMAYAVDMSGSQSWTVQGRMNLPSNAVLRFEDDFTDNRNDWGFDTEDENVFFMRPSGGEYCILIKSSEWTAWESYEPFRPDEFVAEVSCRVEGFNDASCGLGFGPDGDNLYWFEVSPFDQTFAVFLLEDDTWQDNLIEWTDSKAIDPDGANYLSMERIGGALSLYVNGVLVGEVDGSRFPTGRVGIGGSTYEDPDVTVCLDNLRVWRME